MQTTIRFFITCLFWLALPLLSGCGNNTKIDSDYHNAEDILLNQLRQTYRFETDDKQITILVKGVDEQRRLIKPTIRLEKESITIEAETAEFSTDFSTNTLSITLADCKIINGESGSAVAVGNRTIQIPLAELFEQ